MFAVDNVVVVFLQENNAFAVLDIASETWVDIYSCGVKDFASSNRLDASDKDGCNHSFFRIY